MKKTAILLSILFLAVYWTYAQKSEEYPPFIFKAKTIDGKDIDLTKVVGKKLIMVNFWATWCPPCRYEIPDLINLQEEFKDSLLLVGVALDNNVEPVLIFSQRYKINYPIVYDTRRIPYLYGGISSIPTTFIINYEGKIVERIIGARSFDAFKSILQKYLKENQKSKK